jgi:hypothetical protein
MTPVCFCTPISLWMIHPLSILADSLPCPHQCLDSQQTSKYSTCEFEADSIRQDNYVYDLWIFIQLPNSCHHMFMYCLTGNTCLTTFNHFFIQ